MAEKYDHKAIEKKWQDRWDAEHAFTAEENSSKPKTYVLDMFPYPSGEGLHVGHVEGYTATDIYSRYKRMQGYNVLHPMGWDAFGLPAENYAIKTGVPPQETTDKSIGNFRKQIKALGLSYDWSREVGTHNPDYYQWTQWLFTKFFEKGLVYKKKALVNWDPVDQTVLANEQVLPDGTAERSGAKVEKRDLEQWFFKITDYADQLHDDLDTVDWPESTKINQRNWIGRSEGAEIDFALSNTDKKVKVFTTRPDTLFGATYLVLAPEHPLVAELAEKSSNKDEVLHYAEGAKNKSDIERSAEGKEKTGIELKGVKAVNPATKEEVPVFIADYVLGHYGTGAIMAVPAHDERDFEFAQKFELPIRQVVVPCAADESNPPKAGLEEIKRDTVVVHLRDKATGKFALLNWHGSLEGITTAIMGGIESGQTPEEAALAEIKEEAALSGVSMVKSARWITAARYCASHKNQNRCAHAWAFLAEVDNLEGQGQIESNEQTLHTLVWVPEEEVAACLTPQHQKQMWHLLQHDEAITGAGYLIHSGEFDGLDSEEAKKKITESVGGTLKKTYRLRDWLISRQRYWGAPIPVVYDPEGKPHAIPQEHLPWLLPTDVEFKPTGTSPLGQSKELLERTERTFGKGWKPEIDTMDTFACSSWYFFRFADPKNEKEFASKEAMQQWMPVDLYVGGAEHTVLHLLYARFFTKALRDMGHLSFDEPFLKLRHQGIILAEDSRKMSKRWGNVINPDDMAEKFGADALRMYEMFMGPLEAMKPWNTRNIAGLERFIDRVWKLELTGSPMSAMLETLVNQTIKKVGEDIENLKLNTAVSALMILLNAMEKETPRTAYVPFLQLLAPFAPHLASELLERLGETNPLQLNWPTYDESKLLDAMQTIAVQVNGKVRGSIELPAGAGEEEALSLARSNPAVAKWLEGKTEKRALFVPGKIVNFVAE